VLDLEDLLLAMVVVVTTVVVRLVGRTGGTGAAEVVEAGQLAEPQLRSVGQQPPPREAGQERKPELQVSAFGVLVTVTVRVTVEISGGRVDVDVCEDVEIVVEVEVVGGEEAEGVIVV